MQILVMGSGGVGGYFGARLAAAGNDVTFVARGGHFEAIRTNGLRVSSVSGALHIKPTKVVERTDDAGAPQVVFFATKMGDTQSAARQLRP